jgi:hypothetical protein
VKWYTAYLLRVSDAMCVCVTFCTLSIRASGFLILIAHARCIKMCLFCLLYVRYNLTIGFLFMYFRILLTIFSCGLKLSHNLFADHQTMGHVGFGMLDTLNNLHEYIYRNLQMLPLVCYLKHVCCNGIV